MQIYNTSWKIVPKILLYAPHCLVKVSINLYVDNWVLNEYSFTISVRKLFVLSGANSIFLINEFYEYILV